MTINEEAILSIQNLGVSVSHQPENRILNNVDLEVLPGEIHALVGESGSGKSVASLAVMRLLPDALKIDAGKITLRKNSDETINLFHLTEQEMGRIRGRHIAMIFQEALTSLNPVQRVGDQITEALLLHTELSERQRRDKALELLEEVGIPDPERRIDWYPHQLSGGQQQRIMIAMALACEPDVLIADEPTTALDVTIQKQVLKLIRKLARQRNLAVLLITHDMGVVRKTADCVSVMYQGQVIEQAACEDFFNAPKEDYSRRLVNSLPDQDSWLEDDDNEENLVNPLLSVDQLEVHFPIRKGVLQRVKGHVKAVDNISFNIHKGETLALVGESGSGKSTTGRAILNLDRATSGQIFYDGLRIDELSHRTMMPLRKKIQVIFQNPYSSMNPRMNVGKIIEEGMVSLGLDLSPQERAERVESLLTRVKLEPEHRLRYPHEFSGGQRQRIAIARALAVEPELIICDEPTSALDVSIRAEILDLLFELQQELGVSYLFITHDLSIIPRLAHRVAVMKEGRIVEQGPAQRILKKPRHKYTKALLSAVPRVDKPNKRKAAG